VYRSYQFLDGPYVLNLRSTLSTPSPLCLAIYDITDSPASSLVSDSLHESANY
jgi:hypothetical protein